MVAQPQSNFQSNQNFDLDVQEMFRDFITGGTTNDTNNSQNVAIDDLRSQINIDITNQSTKKLLASLNIGNSTDSSQQPSTSNITSTSQIAQESRCHTFFRIIGFPVVDANISRFYNPGFDIIKQGSTRQIMLSNKIDIAGNPIAGFEQLSKSRELYQSNTSKVFAVPDTLEAAILSLTSGTYGDKGNVNIRKFVAPFDKNDDPFDMMVVNQSYSIGGITLVGNKEINLLNFQDASGNMPNTQITNPSVFIQHQHIIKPFIVDPRIDFSTYPIDSATASGVSKKVAVPFVPDQSFLRVSANSYAERPLLEKIIRERFSQADQTLDAGQATQDLVSYVKSFKAIQNVDLVNQVFSNNLFKLSQQSAFVQYLSIIQALVFKLVDCMRIVHAAQGVYYWLPQNTTKFGPEGGLQVRKVIVSSNLSTDLITTDDLNIIFKSASAAISSINASVSQSNAIPDVGGYAFSAFKFTFAPDSTNSLKDLNNNTLDVLVNKRNSVLNKAGQALQIIEMIMGEFSGLGLCDIIAVVAALYVVDKQILVEFLDNDALIRMNTTLNTNVSHTMGLQSAMNTFSQTVKSFYIIMDQIFADYLNNNALNI